MRRWPLFAAIGFALLFAVGQVIVPAPPHVTDSGEKVVAYYRDHAAGVRLALWLTALAGLVFVPLVAWMRTRLRGIGRDVFLIGAATIVIETGVLTWLVAALALHADQMEPHTARLVADIGSYYGPGLTLAVTFLAAPIGWAALREGAFPRWVGWLSVVLVAEQLIETVTIFGKRGFIAPGGPMNLMLGAGLFIVWFVATAASTPAEAG